MSDQSQMTQVAFDGKETQAGQPAPPTPEPATTGPQYITPADLEQFKKDLLVDAYRQTQSFVDKSNKKVQEELQRVNRDIDTLRKAGVQITPAQEAALQREAVASLPPDVSGEPSPDGVGQTPPEGAPQLTPLQQAVTNMAAEMHNEYGFGFEENDPEVQSVVRDGTELEYINSYRQALEAKRQRIGGQPQEPTPPRAPNLGTGSAVANPIANQSGAQLWNTARKKMGL
jgi:hypothetical protein